MGKIIKCSMCGTNITGNIKICKSKKKLGNKLICKDIYYDESCFLKINIESSWDEYRKKEIARQRKNNK